MSDAAVPSCSGAKATHKRRRTKSDSNSDNPENEIIKNLKHFDVFYNQPPPGMVKEDREAPEDCIPDLPENKDAREFLAKAPQKGLWMPLGKEVKVMKCWRCKAYGHRTGDRECPMFLSGNTEIEKFRFSHEDPMHNFITETKKQEKDERIRQLQALLDSSTSSSSSDSSDSSSSDSYKNSKSKTSKRKKKSKHKSKKRSIKKKKK